MGTVPIDGCGSPRYLEVYLTIAHKQGSGAQQPEGAKTRGNGVSAQSTCSARAASGSITVAEEARHGGSNEPVHLRARFTYKWKWVGARHADMSAKIHIAGGHNELTFSVLRVTENLSCVRPDEVVHGSGPA